MANATKNDPINDPRHQQNLSVQRQFAPERKVSEGHSPEKPGQLHGGAVPGQAQARRGKQGRRA